MSFYFATESIECSSPWRILFEILYGLDKVVKVSLHGTKPCLIEHADHIGRDLQLLMIKLLARDKLD